jgi:hypothetical protein
MENHIMRMVLLVQLEGINSLKLQVLGSKILILLVTAAPAD